MGDSGLFNFGEALVIIKNGGKVCREGWNGKGMFIYLEHGSSPDADTEHKERNYDFLGVSCRLFNYGDTGTGVRMPSIAMSTAQGTKVVGWLASQVDMLAEDWMLAE